MLGRGEEKMAFYSADKVAPQRVSDKVTRRLVSGEKLMLAIHEVAGGTVVDPHHHESEQILYVLSGTTRFRLGEEEREMAPGDFVVVPSNAEHSAHALADTKVLEVFSPIREDWL
jgi:quercetin dioxygenase-like cupin family protein